MNYILICLYYLIVGFIFTSSIVALNIIPEEVRKTNMQTIMAGIGPFLFALLVIAVELFYLFIGKIHH